MMQREAVARWSYTIFVALFILVWFWARSS